MLRHGLIEVILNHQHNRGGLAAPAGIFVDWPRIHLVVGPQAVHIDTPVLAQLLGELLRQYGVVFGRKIAQGVPDSQHLFLGREYLLAFGRMVDLFVIRLRGGQPVGNTRADIVLELLQCHRA